MIYYPNSDVTAHDVVALGLTRDWLKMHTRCRGG